MNGRQVEEAADVFDCVRNYSFSVPARYAERFCNWVRENFQRAAVREYGGVLSVGVSVRLTTREANQVRQEAGRIRNEWIERMGSF